MKRTGYRLKTMARKNARSSFDELIGILGKWLCFEELFDETRQSIFTAETTFWMFLAQVFAADGACREVLRKYQAWRALTGKKEISPNTGGYCQARARLPLCDMRTVHERLVDRINEESPLQPWCGHPVIVVDGSSVSMPDTPENQERYPQPSPQKQGCGFPVMRIVVYFALSSGIILDVAKSALNVGEAALSRSLWDMLKSGDVLLTDRGFCSYADIYYLGSRNVDCVMRSHQRRSIGVKKVKQMSSSDRLVHWCKTKCCPKWLSKAQWNALPDILLLREIKVTVATPGFRTQNVTVVTTLLDHKQFPEEAFAELYRRRWLAELFLRDIKIAMNMDVLRCKTPDMVDKELYMHLIAYNLVRALMLQAAAKKQRAPLRLSFKGTVATVRQWAPLMASASLFEPLYQQMLDAMLNAIAGDPVPERPDRAEPRARKRRPKNYQLLTKPRREFRECPHRSKYVKA